MSLRVQKIYDGERYRRPSVFWLLLGALIAALPVVFFLTHGRDAATLESWDLAGFLCVTALFVGGGGWMILSEIRSYLFVPRAICILDNGAIEVRMRKSDEILDPAAFTEIVFTDHRHVEGYATDGYLRAKTATMSWYMPSSVDEAEEFISCMTLLNPAIRIERR